MPSQANLVPARKVLKLNDGKYTAYPDLVFGRSSPPKKATDEVIGKRVKEDATLAEGDIRRLRIERLNKLYEIVELDKNFLERGSWNDEFLYQHLANLENISKATVSLPRSEDHIAWLRVVRRTA